MTLYRRGRVWWYDFTYERQRHWDTTKQTDKDAAHEVEVAAKRRVRREAAGLPPEDDDASSPRIQDWAEVYAARAHKTLTRPERVDDLLRVVLRFFGARPAPNNKRNPPVAGEPYHDLRLLDPIRDPDWLEQFEQWMDARGRSGQTKNQYRSCMSQLYRLALQPRYRKRTRVAMNPFAGIYRDETNQREVVIGPEDLRRLLANASYHVRLAVAIGALAPKLRLANILALRWDEHLDPLMQYLTVHKHKTRRSTKKPLVIPVSAQLRRILQDARRRNRGEYVVVYRSRPIQSIRDGVRRAAKRAGVPYGRAVENGITFHTLRHTAATLLAELDVAESKRKSVLGHKRMETTQRYTHMRPVYELDPLELLSGQLPVEDLVTNPLTRVRRQHGRGVVGIVGGTAPTADQIGTNLHDPEGALPARART